MARPTPGDYDDDQPWLAEGVREARSTLVPRARLFGGMLVALLLAVLVGLGVYLASGHKSDGSAGYARPADAPLITADAGAYKVQPADPGGARITGIDDSVAAVAGGRDEGSAILPEEPEEPLARPAAGAPTTGPAPPPSVTVPPPTDLLPRAMAPAAPPAAAALPSRPIAVAPVVAPAARPASPADATAKPVATPPKKALATADAAPAAVKPAKPQAVAVAKPQAVATADADPLAAAPAKLAKAPAEASGSVALQLGAFSTRDKADAAWTTAGGDGALSGLAKRIEPVERNGATLYRLRAAGVASRDAAKALCGRIKAAGNACIVAE